MASEENDKGDPTVRVHFPCVHGLATGQTVTINCFPAREMKGTIKVVNGVDEEIARRIIGASRYGEKDERAGIGVIALFSNPLFSGESYGLALAVADKLARLQRIGPWEAIYATGKIPADGCGQVDAINGFAEKLSILLDIARPDTLFLYPQQNHPSTDSLMEQMQRLQLKGMRCLPVAHLDDLQGRLWSGSSSTASRKSIFTPLLQKVGVLPPVAWWSIGTVFLVTLTGILLVFTFYFSNVEPEAPKQTVVDGAAILPAAKKNTLPVFSHQETQQQGIDARQVISRPETERGAGLSGKPTSSPPAPEKAGTFLESVKVNPDMY